MIRLLLCLSLAAMLSACSPSEKATADEPKPAKQKIIEVSAEAREKSGITTDTASPAVIRKTVKLNGKIGPNEDQIAHVSPRFPGIVKSIAKRLGDPVKTGESWP